MKTGSSDVTCDDALAVLTATGDATSRAGGAALDAARGHVARCPSCHARLAGLTRAILSGRDDEIPCAECQDALADYLAALDAAVDVATAFPLVHRHRATCRDCREVEAVVRAIMRIDAAGSLAALPPGPAFDVAFVTRSLPVAHRPPAPTDVVAVGVARWRHGVLERVAGWRATWRERQDGWASRPDGGGPLRTVLVMGPLLVLLLVALGISWSALQRARLLPPPDTARQTADARAADLTATAAASATVTVTRGPAGALTPGAPASGAGRSAVTRPVATLTVPPAGTSPSPVGAADRRERDRRARDGSGAPGPVPATTVPTPAPDQPVALETAYPRLATSEPPTAYPPPATVGTPPKPVPTRASPGPPSGDR
jgi:hypothetical protein